MANLARKRRLEIEAQHPGAVVIKRPRNGVHFALDATQRIAFLNGSDDHHLPDGTEIDTAWVAEEVDGFQWGMTLAEYHARARSVFNAGSLVRFTHPESGHWVIFDPQSLNWRDANNSQSQIAVKQNVTATVGEGDDDDLLTWANGYGSGRHLTYRCVPERLEKNIVIDTAADLPAPPGYMVAPIWFEAEFTLSHSAGLDLYLDGVLWAKVNNERITTANAIEFREGAVTLFRMARPFARDSAGATADCQYEVRNQNGIYFVTVRVPQTWLAAAVYPVYVDPTLSVSSYTSDGYVEGFTPSYATSRSTANTSADAYEFMIVGQSYGGGNYGVHRGFIKFDTSSIDSEFQVDQVNLAFTVYGDSSSTDFDVQIVKQDWSDPLASSMESNFDGCLSGTPDSSIWRNTSGISVGTEYTSGNLSTDWISKDGTKSGITSYSLRSNRDADNTEPTDNEYIQISSVESLEPPTLIVVYLDPRQRAYPDADVSDGSWTPSTGADLYAVIDETIYSDTDYIQSAQNPANDICVIGLSNVTDPAVHTAHTVYYRYRKEGTGQTINLTVRLKQGSTTIASNTHSGIPTTWTDGSFTLLETEADDITDYTDLRLEFEADVP